MSQRLIVAAPNIRRTQLSRAQLSGHRITLNGVDYNIEFSSDNIGIDEEISCVNNIINKPPTIHEVQVIKICIIYFTLKLDLN